MKLRDILKEAEVTWKDIYASNKKTIGPDPRVIQPGQKLKMPDGTTYVVQKGDSLGRIAKNYEPRSSTSSPDSGRRFKTNPDAKPGSVDSLKQPDGTYGLEITGSEKPGTGDGGKKDSSDPLGDFIAQKDKEATARQTAANKPTPQQAAQKDTSDPLGDFIAQKDKEATARQANSDKPQQAAQKADDISITTVKKGPKKSDGFDWDKIRSNATIDTSLGKGIDPSTGRFDAHQSAAQVKQDPPGSVMNPAIQLSDEEWNRLLVNAGLKKPGETSTTQAPQAAEKPTAPGRTDSNPTTTPTPAKPNTSLPPAPGSPRK